MKTEPYWSRDTPSLLARLESSTDGLAQAEAARRLVRDGPNSLTARVRSGAITLLARQFANPLVVILAFAAVVSFIAHEYTDAGVVLAIMLVSGVLGFQQEWRASMAVDDLRARVDVRVTLVRAGSVVESPAHEVVVGDIVRLGPGALIPADGVVLSAKDLTVSQAVLTGETFPVEKRPGVVPLATPVAGRTNCVFMGTSVHAGTGSMLVARVGAATEFGHIAARLRLRPPETEFEHGIRRFGYLIAEVMFAMVVVVFAVNTLAHRSPIESLLFAIALAVGMAPEMLPAIVTITLSRGARDMARHGVIVRRLAAIENFGSMDVLCSDKTGTLTEGVVRLDRTVDVMGETSTRVLELAVVNATLQTGLANALDQALAQAGRERGVDLSAWRAVDELAYDFVRRRLSVVAAGDGATVLITKGAVDHVFEVCTSVRRGNRAAALDPETRLEAFRQVERWGDEGLRVLAVASKTVDPRAEYQKSEEIDLCFEGFLLFFDPPKAGIAEAIAALRERGVALKIISGDSRFVVRHVASQIGLQTEGMVTGQDLDELHDEALWHIAEKTTLFAEVDPNQKERVILALRKTGHVVGYMGDGINDAPALHAADVGISVEGAVDVARDAADFVLVRRDLDVLRVGVEDGRTTFDNTIKYISTTTSANFGNMFSLAGASLFLPFLPLVATQVLLNNFLSDLPAMTIASDRVDPERIAKPRRWNIGEVRHFMVVFGLVSSFFDYLTFGLLYLVLRSTAPIFRTGWFVESLMTELLIVLVVRTRRPLWQSRPSAAMLWSIVAVAVVAIALPYTPAARVFELAPLPPWLLASLLGISAAYMLASEWTKHWFFRAADARSARGQTPG